MRSRYRNIIKVMALLCFVIPAAISKAALPYALTDSGNAEYAKGNYTRAADFYLKFLNSGYESADIYYNIGNCYYRTNDIAKSILYYEKAKKLAPNDADVQLNLQLAYQKITDKVAPETQLFFVSWWNSFVNLSSERGWGIICIIFFCAFLGLILLYLMSSRVGFRQLGFWGAIAMLFFSLLSFMLARDQYNALNTHDTGIIMSASVTVKGSPSDNGTQLFVMHEGTKVYIIKTEGGWIEIKLPNGNQGWVTISDVTPI